MLIQIGIQEAIYGQKYLVEYSIFANGKVKNALLYVDSNQSYYKEFSIKSKAITTPLAKENEVVGDAMNQVEQRRASEGKEDRKNKSSIMIRHFSAEKTVQYVENHTQKLYSVKDDEAIVKWQIVNEERKINNYTCQKALGDFRGRNYTVWFTKQIGIKGGPWKLAGLPGLILEAISSDGLYRFEFKILEKVTQLPEKLKVTIESPMLSYQDYLIKADEYYQKDVNDIFAKTSAGFAKKTLGAKSSPIQMAINHIEKILAKTYVSKND
ncbi:MAG: GLPGLI family protein [Saprospiraceae bacterium]|nr:GLPGLI family protein [Saprospiraceae bacterium]